MESTIESLVEFAKVGDKEALEMLILRIQDGIYGLAIRMLYNPADAEDATQEILIKVITHLSDFRQDCKFNTWVYRIASNHLLTIQKSRTESREVSFKDFENIIESQVSASCPLPTLSAEQSLMHQEVMVSCTQGMLLCLDRDLRMAYILGELSEISSNQAANILNITSAAFRKRLSRARTLLFNFMKKNCGLVNESRPCRCSRYVSHIAKDGEINKDNLMFAGHPCRSQKDVVTVEQLREVSELQRVVTIFRSHPDYAAPEKFLNSLKQLFDSGKYRLFGEEH